MQTELQILPAQKNQASIERWREPQGLLQVCGKTGESLEVVSAVAMSVEQKNIRALVLVDDPAAALKMSVILEGCVTTYCGGVNTGETTFDEAIRFVFSQFGHLAFEEIPIAFQLGAAGKLDNVKMETFYGVFTVVMLGSILNAYSRYRNRIVAQMQNEESEKRYAEREMELKSVDWVSGRLARLAAIEAPELTDFAMSDFDLFTKSGHLEYTDEEKKTAWIDAKALAFDDLEQDAAFWDEGKKNPALAAEIKRAVSEARQGWANDKFMVLRESFAKRLLVMRWYLAERTKQGI